MNTFFDNARELFATRQIDWLTDDFRCVAIAAGTPIDVTTMQSLGDIPSSSRIATSRLLTGKNADRGYMLAAPAIFDQLADDRSVGAIVVYRPGTTDFTSDLIAYIDEAGGLPFKPRGYTYHVLWQVLNLGVMRL